MAEHYEYDYKHYFFARSSISGLVTCAVMGAGLDDTRAQTIADALAAFFDVLHEHGVRLPGELLSVGYHIVDDLGASEVIPLFPEAPEGPLLLVIDGHLEPGQVFNNADEAENFLIGLRSGGPGGGPG